MPAKPPLLIHGSSVGVLRTMERDERLVRTVTRWTGPRWTCNGIQLAVPIAKGATRTKTVLDATNDGSLLAQGGWPTRMFELHRRSYLRRVLGVPQFTRYAELLRLLGTFGCQVTLIEPWRDVPDATTYPIKLVELLPHGRWHTGSFDWMLACAILEGYTDITLSSIKFQRGGEPLGAPACLAYWVGYAIGRGVRLRVLNDCDTLFKTYQLLESERQYGREDVRPVEA